VTIKDRLGNSKANSLTLTEHLTELRRRLLVGLGAFVVASVVGFFLYGPLLHFLRQPYCLASGNRCDLYITGPLDGLTVRLQIACFAGVVLASPVLLFELWRFITPGLKSKERRYAVPFILVSLLLFGLGAAIAYVTLEHALSWLSAIGGPSLRPIYNPKQYLSLVMWMMVLFGAAFEFPVILVGLELVRAVTWRQLLGWWRWAIVAITLASALFTPSSDPFSMLMLMVPLIVFYFVSIGLGWLFRR
jgi:sec-independent protein translocase protein TatC